MIYIFIKKMKLKIIKKIYEEEDKIKDKIIMIKNNKMMNVIDIGSHNGKTKNPTYKYLDNPKYQVYHIEANINMKEDLDKLNSIKSFCAISDFNGEGKLYFDKRGFLSRQKGEKLNKKKGMRNSLEKDNTYLNSFLTDEYCEVQVKTLDTLLSDLDITSIELLKIDTEGTDYKILKKYSFNIKPKKIITEDFFQTNKDKYTLLKSKGYKLKHKNLSDSTWIL